MPIQFNCPICQSLLGASDDQVNSIVRCPSCQTTFQLLNGSPSIPVPVHSGVPLEQELTEPETALPTEVAPPFWKDPIVVIGTAVPTLILVTFFGYLVWSRIRADAPTMQLFQRKSIEQVNVKPDAVVPVPQPKDTPQAKVAEKPSPPNATAIIAPSPVAKAAVIQPNLAPQPEKAGPPFDNPGPNVDQKFDLRGPAPKIGFKVREHTKVTGTNTRTMSKPRMTTVPYRSDLVHETEKIYTVADVVNDNVREYETKVITGDITLIFVDATVHKRTSEQLDNFVGETIRSKKRGGLWSHTLLNELPTEKEQKALTQLRPFFQDREFVPINKQKFGASWDVDRDYIDILIRTNMSAVSGKVKATFVRLIQYQGETCGLIEYNGKIRGSIDLEENQERVCSISIGMTVFRSLRNSIDAKTSGEIIIQSADTMTDQGGDAEVTTLTRLVINSTVTLEQ